VTAPLLASGEIRARRRPGAIAIVYLLRAAFGLALAWPLSELFARRTMTHPREDAILFDPGGLYLVEAFRLGHAAIGDALRGLSAASLLVFAFGLLPLGALLHALGRGGAIHAADLAAAAVRLFARFSVLLCMATLAMSFAVLGSVSLAAATRFKIAPGLSDQGADVLVALPWVFGAGLFAAIGVIHDLARAQVAQRDLGVLDAVRAALHAAARRPAAAFFGWAWRALAGAILVAAAAVATSAVGIDRTGALGVVTLVHQAAVVGVVSLRASWLACALRLSEAARDASRPLADGPEDLLVATGRAIPADVQAHDPAP
jgi:hypothetical protein